MSRKLIAVCSTCGSDRVLSDAYAVWNVISQQWELMQTFDKGAYCEQCDGETTLKFERVRSVA